MNFRGSRHCVHCGARGVEHDAASVGTASNLKCPRCAERPGLEPRTLGALTASQCPQCTGVFVPERVLEDMVRQRDEAAVLARELPPGERAGVEDKVRYLHCAVCDDLMLRSNYGRRSGVIVDRCKKHGVWFDADELRRVADFVARGGLDETRRRELEDADRQLAQRRAAAATTPRSSYEASRSDFGAGVELVEWLFRILR